MDALLHVFCFGFLMATEEHCCLGYQRWSLMLWKWLEWWWSW